MQQPTAGGWACLVSRGEPGMSVVAASRPTTTSTLVETVNINLDEFSESFLTCSTCLLLYDQEERKAKLLPCSHSVCLSCLQQIAALPQSDAGLIKCPMCREETILPSGGVTTLPAAFLINQLLDVMQKQRKDVVPSCTEHPSDQLLYCETCDLVFCERCTSSQINKKCNQHTVIPFAIALKRMSEIVVHRAKGRLRALDQAKVAVSDEIAALDKNVDKIVDQINSAMQEVSNLVENRRRELIESVRQRRDEKRKVLKDQIEIISDEKKKLEKELAKCQMDVRSMPRNLKSLEGNLDSNLAQPRENAFLRLNTGSNELVQAVQKNLDGFGTVYASSTFPSASIIEKIEPAAAAETHTESKFLVRTFDLNGKQRTSGGDPLDVTLISDTGIDCGIVVQDHNDGTYELTFRAPAAGNYIISVDIFGRPLKNSPYRVTVSSHHVPRWQLGVQLKMPTKVAIEDDKFFVLDTGNDRIRVVKETGEVISDIKSPCLHGTAVGMVLLPKNEIAVLNWRTKAITKIDHSGKELQVVSFSELNRPTDLALDRRGRFLIADTDKIFVFDPNLVPLFSFKTKDAKITSVNTGRDDDILVGTSNGLMVFDGAGRYQRDIDLAPTGSNGRIAALSCAVCQDTGQIISGIQKNGNRHMLAVSNYKGSFGFYIDSKGSPLKWPSGIYIGTGVRKGQGQCFVVDCTSDSVKMYRYK